MPRPSNPDLREWRSWQLAAALMRRGGVAVWPVHRHPDGPDDDCLALVDTDGTVHVAIHRTGSIDAAGREWRDWLGRCEADIEALVREIGSASLQPFADDGQPITSMLQLSAETIAFALAAGGRAVPIWDPDIPDRGPVNEAAVEGYQPFWPDLMRAWRTLDPPLPETSPLAWVWAIELGGRPSRLLNLLTGELWRTDGSILGLAFTEGETRQAMSLRAGSNRPPNR